jgi:hypothetical protein
MPTTTWRTIRREILREMGSVEFSTTTNLATGATPDIISTTLTDGYPKDDYFIDYWLLIEGSGHTANEGTIRRVEDYDAGSGHLTLSGANFALSGTSASDILVSPFNPTQVLNFFNKAREDLYPQIAMVRDYETIVTGQLQNRYTLPTTSRGRPIAVYTRPHLDAAGLAVNIVLDGGFEDWASSTSLNKWTLTGSGGAVVQEVQTSSPKNYAVLRGQFSGQLSAEIDTLTNLLQNIIPPTGLLRGQEINVSVWVYSNVAARVRATIQGASVVSTPIYGGYHGGTGWEKLTVTATTYGPSVVANVGVEIDSGAALRVFIDECIATVGQSEIPEMPWQQLLDYEWMPPVDGASNGGTLRLNYPVPELQQLRIVCRDLLTAAAVETTAIEIDGEQLAVLEDKTRAKLAEAHDDNPYYEKKAAEYNAKVQDALNRGVGMRVPRPTPRVPGWTY